MALLATYNRFLVPATVTSSSTAAFCQLAGVVVLAVTVVIAQSDADDEQLDTSKEAWETAKSHIDRLIDDFDKEAVPALAAWRGTKDREKFDDLIKKIKDELSSISTVFKSNADALDKAKSFYNKLALTILTATLTMAGAVIALFVFLFTPAAPGAKAAQWVVVLGWAGIIVGLLAAITGIWSTASGLIAGGDFKFSKDVDKSAAGGEISFEDIKIDLKLEDY